jgi:hypothetical protein
VRLRLADWGSQAAYQDDAPWPDIATIPTGTQITAEQLATDFTSANGWYWAPPVDAGDGTSAITIDYKCTKGGAAFCPQLADMSNPQQALLVELSVPSGNWAITTAATYRNMDFTTPVGSAGSGGASGGASGTSGAPSAGAAGTSNAGAPSGGASVGGASTALGGSTSESEAGNASVGGHATAAGASSDSGGSSAAGTSATQGGAADATAGSSAAPSNSDKGGSCGCRLAKHSSSNLADFLALFALGMALQRRRNRKLQIRAQSRPI